MEQTFGAGTMLKDYAPPARARRPSARKKPQGWAAALIVALTGLLLWGGVAYGGASSGTQQVVVHSGDTLWAIAQSHYSGDDIQQRVTQLEAVNHVSSGALRPGQILTLPAP